MALSESIDFTQIPLIALRIKTKCAISQMLNGFKVIPSPSGLPRDWRGLGHIAATDLPPINSCNPTNFILEKWTKTEATFKDLIESFKELDRWDVLYDTLSSIESDATFYLNSKDSDKVLTVNDDIDELVLTVDDIQLTQNGEAPQIYDAFLLYSDADVEFAMEVVDNLENRYGLKLCLKDRDLVGGISFEHEAIMRLISERCNRLIIIVTPSFLDSPENKFFVTFAQALGIKQQYRKIIPCIYKRFPLPPQLDYYHKLDYTRHSQFCDFWKKLSDSVVTIPKDTVTLKNALPSVSISELTDEESREGALVDSRKPESWTCPSKIEAANGYQTKTDNTNDKASAVVKSSESNAHNESVKSLDTTNSSSKQSKKTIIAYLTPRLIKKKIKTKKKKVLSTS